MKTLLLAGCVLLAFCGQGHASDLTISQYVRAREVLGTTLGRCMDVTRQLPIEQFDQGSKFCQDTFNNAWRALDEQNPTTVKAYNEMLERNAAQLKAAMERANRPPAYLFKSFPRLP